MIRPKRFFSNFHCTLEKGLGFSIPPLIIIQTCYVIEGCGDVWMIRTEGLFINF